jgi:glycosyltransferase involved in cell wall biosynthesis
MNKSGHPVRLSSPIFLLVPSLEQGGTERQVALLALALHARDIPVHVIVFRGGVFAREIAAAGIPLTILGDGRWVSYFLALARLLRREKPSVLYSFLPHGNVVSAIARVIDPQCRLVWGIRSANMPLKGYSLKTRAAYCLERLLSRLPHRIIVNSKSGAESCVAKGFPAGAIRVIENGFDTKLFRPDPQTRAVTRTQLGLRPNEIAIGLPARIDPVKGHRTFLAAASHALKSNSTLRFFCIGGGSQNLMNELKSFADGLGIAQQVIWTGNREDMPTMLNALDIAGLCSDSEGFPNAVGEAMACGVPCVATDVGDTRRLIADTGFIVPPRDPQVLADAWRRLLDAGERHRLGSAARARIVENFSLDRLADRTLEVFGGT